MGCVILSKLLNKEVSFSYVQLSAEVSPSVKQFQLCRDKKKKFPFPSKKQQSPDFTAQLLFHYQRVPIKATLGDLIAV